MKAKTIVLNGKKVSYFDEGRGYPLVLIYGWVVSKEAFEPMAEVLKKNYRVIVPDWPGHGGSEALAGVHNLENLLIFLDRFLKRLKLAKFHLLGASLGGSLAILYTLKNPKRVDKLILQAPLVSWRQLAHGWGTALILMKPLVALLGRISFFQIKFHNFFQTYAFPQELAKIKSHLAPGRWNEVGKSVGAVMNAFDHRLSRRASSEFGLEALKVDLRSEVAQIPHQALIVWGAEDHVLNKKTGLKIRQQMRNARYLELRDSSHHAIIEKHREIAQEINKFLSP